MTTSLAALLYLLFGAVLIMALRGLSTPATSRQDNTYGMVGMAMIFGFLALVLASVNIFGGFLVTNRMLAMYKKKEK